MWPTYARQRPWCGGLSTIRWVLKLSVLATEPKATEYVVGQSHPRERFKQGMACCSCFFPGSVRRLQRQHLERLGGVSGRVLRTISVKTCELVYWSWVVVFGRRDDEMTWCCLMSTVWCRKWFDVMSLALRRTCWTQWFGVASGWGVCCERFRTRHVNWCVSSLVVVLRLPWTKAWCGSNDVAAKGSGRVALPYETPLQLRIRTRSWLLCVKASGCQRVCV